MQEIIGKSAAIGLEGFNCIELSNELRKSCSQPLIHFTQEVRNHFSNIEIPFSEICKLIESQCDRLESEDNYQDFDLCVVGQPDLCSIGTWIDQGVLFLSRSGKSLWLPTSKAPILDGSWRVRKEWLT